MGTDSSSQQNKRQGFSLVESAIVLAVVGLVIGGIWVASAKFYEDYKVNKTVEGIFTIAHNVQNLVSFRDAAAIGSKFINSTIIAANAAPINWIQGNTIQSPLGSDISVANGTNGIKYYFWVGARKLTIIQCTKLILAASSITAASGNKEGGTAADKYRTGSLLYINVGGWGAGLVSQFPSSIETANAACNAGLYSAYTDGYLLFVFSYTRTN